MKRTTLTTSVAISALLVSLSGSAFAQNAPDVLNSQIQLGDAFSNMNVVVEGDHSGDVSSIALSTGNAASGFGSNDAVRHVESNQTMSGNSTANATLEGDRVFGTASADATAYGNSTTGSQFQADSMNQTVGTNRISSTATVNHISATTLNASATSAANIQDMTYDGRLVPDGESPTLRANANQTSQADVDANIDATVCCSVDDTNANTLAVGNSFQSSSEYSNAYANVQQTSYGNAITANTRLTQPEGNNISANSQAMGNNIVMDNSWGYSQLDGSQTNTSAINATTEIVLNDWDGDASISAYGVGNSAMQTNIGSDQNAYYAQNNSGEVVSLTDFEGGNGGAGNLSTSSTAIGNTYTGYVCATCQSAVPGGALTQTNSGNVTSTGQAWARGGGNVYGSAAAIGNSANYSTNNAGGHD
ncbi:holdfast anchor protein HfaD [Hirschia litorea]|uniref:Holdfast anchor protein HfaD n=1 Tax=Hirschia litorea TaxID=1199156 RepID=A0ABW2ILC2_9PROT